jgi:uncharacterized protein (DUF305 family)
MGFTWRLTIISIFFYAQPVQVLQHGSHTRLGDQVAVEDSWAHLNSSMDRMHAAMASVEPSSDCDVDFVSLMLPHHQGAIDMAKAELLHGKDPQMRRLAQEIITDQESEIQLMQLWLTKHEANSHDPTRRPGSDLGRKQ